MACAYGKDCSTTHQDPNKLCYQHRIEALSDTALLSEIEAYAESLRNNGLVPKGWWVELAKRLRAKGYNVQS